MHTLFFLGFPQKGKTSETEKMDAERYEFKETHEFSLGFSRETNKKEKRKIRRRWVPVERPKGVIEVENDELW